MTTAIQLHSSGRMDEAGEIYKLVLADDDQHPDALHLTGVIALQEGRYEQARGFIEKAVAIKSPFPEAYNNLGTVYKALALRDDAMAAYRQAVTLKPDFADAHHNLAMLLAELGQFEEAVSVYRRALTFNSDDALVHVHLGIALQHLGEEDEALIHYHSAVALQPDNPDAQRNLGYIFKNKGQMTEAVTCFEMAVSVQPDNPDVHFALGQVQQSLGVQEAAKNCFQTALQWRPDFAEAHFYLAKTYQDISQWHLAIDHYRKGLAIDPSSAEAHSNLGMMLEETGVVDEAQSRYSDAILLNPDLIEAHLNRGSLSQRQGRFNEAIRDYQSALRIDPNYPQALNNLGVCYFETGQLDDAISYYETAIEIAPDYAAVYNNLGNALAELGESIAAGKCFEDALEHDPNFVGADSNAMMTEHYRIGNTVAKIYERHRSWAERIEKELHAHKPLQRRNDDPDRTLRVGFVSSDLGRHPVGYFVVGLIENLREFDADVYCYSDRIPDDLTLRIKQATDHWRNSFGTSDEALFDAIVNDQIDVLVDLSGHSAHNRLLVFARKPAPVQMSWAGYVATTGLTAMDYLLADAISIPYEEEKFYTEKIVRMPDQWLSYEPPEYAPDVGRLPQEKSNKITFACFSNPGKLNVDVISVWAEILRTTDLSRLVFKYRNINSISNIKRITTAFEANGVSSDRIVLEGKSPHVELLRRYNEVDIALDPFPYSGGVTSCEALWMGVPVITKPGETFASRHTASFLTALDCPDWIATGDDDYVQTARKLANDRGSLAKIRAELRGKMATSTLCNQPLFAANFYNVLRSIWREHCTV